MDRKQGLIHPDTELDFILRLAAIQMHAPVRVVDKKGKVLRKYGSQIEDVDPVTDDADFFSMLLDCGWPDCPRFYYEGEELLYAIIYMFTGCTMLIGPVSMVPVQQSVTKIVCELHHLPSSKFFRIDYCDRELFATALLLIFYLTTGINISIEEVWERNFLDDDLKSSIEKKVVETRMNLQDRKLDHTTYHQEKLEMDCIRKGQTEELRETIKNSPENQTHPGNIDQLRWEKNKAITTISLSSRAAIEGGVNEEEAFTVCDSYERMLETVARTEQVYSVMREAQYKFASMVQNELKKDELPHPLIAKVKKYVFANLSEEIRVSDMAEQFGVNPDYLSYLFHKNTGITIRHYILDEKVKAAQGMLVYTSVSQQDIAFSLNFSSQSHFSAVFKKITGMTPKDYRNYYTNRERN